MQEMFSLAGKIALVTGASRGLGLAMARALAEAGATLVLNGRVAETLAPRVDEFAAAGLTASAEAFDVADETAACAAVARIAETHGRIDILLNNAGIVSRHPTGELETAEWQRVIDVNLTACFVLAREAGRVMPTGGRIINLASVMSLLGRARTPAYVASKHALAGLTRAMADEMGPRGITVNAICPGYFRTDITAELQDDPNFSAYVAQRTPVGRWGEPEELAGAAVFLASPAAGYVNGHLLVVDGGLTATF